MEFKCNTKNCSSSEIINSVSVKMKAKNDELKYFDSQNKEIVCEFCGNPMVKIETEFAGFCTYHGSFNSKSPQEKQAILKKREVYYRENDKNFKDFKRFKDVGN